MTNGTGAGINTSFHAHRIQTCLSGWRAPSSPPEARELLGMLATMMDTIGRLSAGADEPMIDAHLLRTTLRNHVGADVGDLLVDQLAVLPSPAFRPDTVVHPIPLEVPWFALAQRVAIFDPTPDIDFGALDLPNSATSNQTVSAIYRVFPGLEPELQMPDGLPVRVNAILTEGRTDEWLERLAHQLGWWAAFSGALLAIPAGAVSGRGTKHYPAGCFPLAMSLLAIAVGDWTLTIVGNCTLAPLD
jgi:hypothetical protein